MPQGYHRALCNSFVMKKPLQGWESGMLGLETPSHQHDLQETLDLWLCDYLSWCLIRALFDKLIFAFLLKLMKMKVASIHLPTWDCGLSAVSAGLIFCPLGLSPTLGGFSVLNALQLTREKASGEKKARSCG